MNEELSRIVEETSAKMRKAIEHLEAELVKIRAGKASPNMLDGINADYYGNPTPINQVANVTALDARTISIQPWEKPMLAIIERAIMQANIGITPQNDGTMIRLFLPPLTEERRKEMVKKSNAEGENGKVTIRNLRRDSIEDIKRLQKDGMSEDEARDGENEVQDITNKYTSLVEKTLLAKEVEIMAV